VIVNKEKNDNDSELRKLRSEARASLKKLYEIESEEERKERHRGIIESMKIPLKDG
jgi:hypothetical protein